ncbi:hypothetical protein ACGTJS_04600 [Faucicola mancuniensis]|uniref:hypothetical protein n=1 Tax=Faucicola mancuniensis TaxID=1309795 RepID=UPI0039775187
MTMIMLNLNQQDESLLLQAVKQMGGSIEQFILQSMRKEALQTTQHFNEQNQSIVMKNFVPNAETLQAIESARRGEVEHFATYEDMMTALSKTS